jgi:tRNA threonylcarbamoyladenosine biosynthesis protein TsaB
MRILAIDTSSNVLGVAVLDEQDQGLEFNYSFGLKHSSHLVPSIKNLLKFADLELGDIDGYCVSIGPGSFTGLRIGVSTIKALALAIPKKVAAVPSPDVLARNIPYTKDTICVVVDAKKEKFYACFYKYRALNPRLLMQAHIGGQAKPKAQSPKKISPYLLISYNELFSRLAKIKGGILLVGDGVHILNTQYSILNTKRGRHVKIADEKFWYPRAINVARIGLEMLKSGKVVKDVDSLVPLYLHPRDVQVKRR